MKIFLIITISGIFLAQARTRNHTILSSQGVNLIQATQDVGKQANVKIIISGDKRLIESNGIPNHKVGEFPNAGNPHQITVQKNHYKIPLKPKLNSHITKLEMAFDFGVAVNGIPFDPGAAEWYQGDRQSPWQYEALSGAIALGVDENHAHVQPTGAYHYHGLPTLLLNQLKAASGKPSPLIGYAADGHAIYALVGDQGQEMTSSYQLKKGTRPIGGVYDGTFVSDYEFVKGLGNLDECNGAKFHGQYSYFLTKSFPVIPRCFRGTPDPSFRRGRGMGRRGQHHHPPPHPRKRGHRPPHH